MRVEADGSQKSRSLSPSRATNGSSPGPVRKAALSNTLHGANGHAEVDEHSSNGDTNGGPLVDRSHLAPTYHGHDREEVARILIQGLTDLGYGSSATTLSRESGFELETPHASAFRNAVLNGEWPRAELLLWSRGPQHSNAAAASQSENGIQARGQDQVLESNGSSDGSSHADSLALAPGAVLNELLFLIRQQKYLELLESRDLTGALMVLRQELTPLHVAERQLPFLSRYSTSHFATPSQRQRLPSLCLVS